MAIIYYFISVVWTAEEFSSMNEDYELCLKICRYFTRDGIGFPANKTAHDLLQDAEFDGVSEEKLVFNLYRCKQAGLLEASITLVPDNTGIRISVNHIIGLTGRGQSFALDSDEAMNQVLENIRNKRYAVTLERIVEEMWR
ncbi:MAG: hypothetical protein OXI01_24145 [Albidovulum sp.]|nr:hypothetical protein [Albidovulum sp.]